MVGKKRPLVLATTFLDAPMTMPVRSRALDVDVVLAAVTPRVWRRLTVPADLTLLDLHHAIQIVMGWRDVHLHVFEIRDREYGPRPEEEGEREQWAGDDASITVTRAFRLAEGPFDYVYDLGDDWRVRIERIGEGTGDHADSVVCVDGEGAGPPDDGGGPTAFDTHQINTRLRAAFRPKASPARPAGAHASEQQQQLATLTLATLVLGSRRGKHGQREASKTMRVEILEALQEADLIYTDPKRQTVVITEAGLAQAQAFLDALPAPGRSEDDGRGE
jgi:hypothetical protein